MAATTGFLSRKAEAILISGGMSPTQMLLYGIYNVIGSFGAKGDMKASVVGASTASSSTITVSDGNFTSADIGKVMCVSKAGGSNKPIVGTIGSITSSTQVVLSGATASASVTGASVNWGTDDTSAIQAAITAAFNASGGIVWFPAAVYMVNGAFQDTSVHNAQLIFPTNTAPAPSIGIFLVGASIPQWWAPGCAGLCNTYPNMGGSVIFSPRDGTGVGPALISTGPESNGNNYSTVSVSIENLILRTAYQNPHPLQVLQLSTANTISINNVGIDIDWQTTDLQSVAPVATGYGLVMPGNNNAPFDTVRNCTVTGYDNGVYWGENGHLDYAQTLWCNNGFLTQTSTHSLTATRICSDECIHPLTATGGAYLNVDLLDIEHGPSGQWFSPGADIVDSSNTLHGVLKYLIITSGVGVDNGSFSKTGGANLTCTALT